MRLIQLVTCLLTVGEATRNCSRCPDCGRCSYHGRACKDVKPGERSLREREEPAVRCRVADVELSGCGSFNVIGPDAEGLYDCLDCGLWFKAGEEV